MNRFEVINTGGKKYLEESGICDGMKDRADGVVIYCACKAASCQMGLVILSCIHRSATAKSRKATVSPYSFL